MLKVNFLVSKDFCPKPAELVCTILQTQKEKGPLEHVWMHATPRKIFSWDCAVVWSSTTL